MNIIHFVETLQRGGLERMVVDLVRMQHRAGHACRVICLFGSGVLADELTAEGIPVDTCNKRSGWDMRALARARSLIAEQGDVVLHTHNVMAHYYAVLATKGMDLRCVVNTRHGMGPGCGGRRHWLYRLAMSGTDYVVAVCDAARERLFADGVRPKLRLLSIPNGIHVDRFEAATADSRRQLHASLGLPAGTRVVGSVGRLNPVKDQATMVRAFARVRAALPDTALVLVGGGALRDELQALAVVEGVAPWVRLLGDRDDVGSLLRGFDLFVLSSLTEGYSMALLEACAAALPIVATDVGGNPEIVREGVNGRLVPPREPLALTDAIIDLLQADPVQLHGMGRAGREWVQVEGSFERMVDSYTRLYRANDKQSRDDAR